MNISLFLKYLDELFPNVSCELTYNNHFELLIAVILSAQTTDKSVNNVTPNLFAHFPTPAAMAKANNQEIEELIKRLGLYRNKADSIIKCSQILVEKFDGNVPNDFDNLISLNGVGRKVANVILAEAFHIPALAVDTHVQRIAKRLGLANQDDSVLVVEKKLCQIIPIDSWCKVHHQLIHFGRYHCTAIKPKCERCKLKEICNFCQMKLIST